MFRIASAADRPSVAALWQEAFGDSPEAVAAFFAAFPACRSYVAEEEGRVVSMVHGLPQMLRADVEIPAAYLYAVATRKASRGRGLCRGLMAFAEADLQSCGFACAVLTPGGPELFGFYKALGYKADFSRRRTLWDGVGEEVSAAQYGRLREALLRGPHMDYDAAALTYAKAVYGLRFYKTPGGCAAAGPACTAEVLPADLGGEPFAMVKWLDTPHPLEKAYLGFALE